MKSTKTITIEQALNTQLGLHPDIDGIPVEGLDLVELVDLEPIYIKIIEFYKDCYNRDPKVNAWRIMISPMGPNCWNINCNCVTNDDWDTLDANFETRDKQALINLFKTNTIKWYDQMGDPYVINW